MKIRFRSNDPKNGGQTTMIFTPLYTIYVTCYILEYSEMRNFYVHKNRILLLWKSFIDKTQFLIIKFVDEVTSCKVCVDGTGFLGSGIF